MNEFAPDVPLSEVEWRVDGKVDGGGGARVVPYLDVPIVTRLLDEWVGPWRWRTRFEPTGKEGSMWCHLSIADGHGEWVTKPDLGTASNFEADKGLVSDALKRAAMRQWGVGRNVFALPILRLPQGKFKAVQDRNGNTQAYLTDESMAWIAAELKRRGHEDAAQSAEQASPPAEQPEPEPERPPQLTSAQAWVQGLVGDLDGDQKTALAEWWRGQQLPGSFADLSDEQCQAVSEQVDAVTGSPF